MRAFQKKNIASFSIFGVLIVIAVFAIGFVVLNYVKNDDSKIELSVNNVIFDDNDRVIEISNGGSIKKKWDENYYLIDEKGRSESLGKTPLIYDKSTNTLRLLGSSYRIFPDGTTLKNNAELAISNFTDNTIYKLADRMYVIIGKEIYSYQPGFESTNFMKVKIDRNGNGLMQAIGLNKKSISGTVLVSGNLYFDVASELLYCDGIETNLKKVIGSTNEYNDAPVLYNELGIERPETSTANKEIPDIEEYNITGGAGGQGGIGGEGGQGGFGGNAGNGGIGGNAGSGGQGGQGGIGGSGGNAGTTREDDIYTINVSSIDTGVSSLTLNYSVYDPQNNYASIYMTIKNGNSEQKCLLNKYESKYTVFNLEQNELYDVSISYQLYKVDNDKFVPDEEKLLTKSTVRTKSASADLYTKVINVDNNNKPVSVDLNLCLSGYNINTAETNSLEPSTFDVVYHYDNGLTQRKTLKVRDSALTESGQNFTIELQDEILPDNNLKYLYSTVSGIEIKEIQAKSSYSENNFTINVDYYQAISETNSAQIIFGSYSTTSASFRLLIKGYEIQSDTCTVTIKNSLDNSTIVEYQVTGEAFTTSGQSLILNDLTGVTGVKIENIKCQKNDGNGNTIDYTVNFDNSSYTYTFN